MMCKFIPASILLLLWIAVVTMSLVSCGGSDLERMAAGHPSKAEENRIIAIIVVAVVIVIALTIVVVYTHKASSKTYRADYRGDSIEIETSTDAAGTGQFSLIINNKKVDQGKIFLGKLTLRGELPEREGRSEQVTAKVESGAFGVKCTALEIDGVEHSVTKV